MIKKIIIDNFMAHEHTELELGSGLTILTGRNNTGKSAVVEALRCLATNPVPSHNIRHGAKEARVSVELDDGTRVVWVRKKRSSGYELWKPGAEEPEEYWKFGRIPPEDIRAALRLDLVELESGDPVDIHVGNQREPVFLLNKPASNAAAFFAASTESAHLLAMQNLLKRQTTDAKRQVRDLEGQTERIEGVIDRLAPLPDIDLQVLAARELEKTAIDFDKIIPALESILERQEKLSDTLLKKTECKTTLDGVLDPPKAHDVRVLDALISSMKTVKSRLSYASGNTEALNGLQQPDPLENTGALAVLMQKLDSADRSLRKAEVQTTVFANLEIFPSPESTDDMTAFIDEFISVQYRRSRLSRWENILRKVVEPPSVESTEGLDGTLSAMDDLSARLESANVGLSKLENSLKKLEETVEERIKQLGCCPTCGGDMTTATFIDQGCRHDG
ncbi:hypothetical protein SYK_22120 [Pseudodesulfovibrio nedwellii]|uniref:DNA repair protein RecN n=1 Tax=Pseudodesulfovibrio nedwellii TaxID=2973072 RepID=A0ABM8B2P2_9BACT|nr:AAA family ATPase [Pseudodesulfovibrio nedwellii]BDQ37852.1 hypothetical protein SYK_22120 [Pseudodesulfovibrio nedwellii]